MKIHEIRRNRRLEVLAQGKKPDGLDSYFERIVRQFKPYIQSLAFSMLGNYNDAEDIVSETICKAYINLHGFTLEERESLKAKAWLSEITRNLCIDYQSKEKDASLERLMEEGYQIVAHPYSNPENALFYTDAVALISKSLARLSLREREIVRRYIMEGEPGLQVAKSLGISASTLYVVAHRTIRKLRHPSVVRPLIVPGTGSPIL
jgi:RNA polymerase sigma factor (sigma-70 family)